MTININLAITNSKIKIITTFQSKYKNIEKIKKKKIKIFFL